jgi:hypothetical protein
MNYNEIYEKIERKDYVDFYLLNSTLEYFISIEDYKKCGVIKNYINTVLNLESDNDLYEKEIEDLKKQVKMIDDDGEASLRGENAKYGVIPGSDLFEFHKAISKSLKDSYLYKIRILIEKKNGTYDQEKESIKSKEKWYQFLEKSSKFCVNQLEKDENELIVKIHENINRMKIDESISLKSETDKLKDKLSSMRDVINFLKKGIKKGD